MTTTVDQSWRWALLERLPTGGWMLWHHVRSAMIAVVRERWNLWAEDEDEDASEAEWEEWAAVALKEALFLGQVEQRSSGSGRILDLRLTPKGAADLVTMKAMPK